MLCQRGNIAVFGAVRVAQMHAQLLRGGPLPGQRHRRQLPGLVDMRRRVGDVVGGGAGHVAGPAGQPFGPDPAFARIDSHAMQRPCPIVQPVPPGQVAVPHMAIGAARM